MTADLDLTQMRRNAEAARDLTGLQVYSPDPEVVLAALDRLELAEEERDDYAFQAAHSARWQEIAERNEAAVERIKALRDEFAAEDHPTSTIISREIQGALDGER